MNIKIKKFEKKDAAAAVEIWNEVVDDGLAFPQLEDLTPETGADFFESQTYTGIAYDSDTNETVGLYILHPNNIGRCGHISNASYAVKSACRGHGIGEHLVKHCLKTARELGFKILQFNAVVASNKSALALYKKLGFTRLGTIPGGFLLKDGTYEDIILHYITL
ncbi:MAG: GNAT family N-acetyltransferase [Clostridiales bacterium]|nr:GNAT family N-acetyltransferase [Clostridiales bacterium]